jgi:hypothetical protein
MLSGSWAISGLQLFWELKIHSLLFVIYVAKEDFDERGMPRLTYSFTQDLSFSLQGLKKVQRSFRTSQIRILQNDLLP